MYWCLLLRLGVRNIPSNYSAHLKALQAFGLLFLCQIYWYEGHFFRICILCRFYLGLSEDAGNSL
jgi:hypothetical protein